MSDIKDIQHKDKISNWLRWLAFGAVGMYLYRVNKVEGKTMAGDFKLDIDADKAVDTAFNVVPLLNKMNPMIQVGLKEFIKGFKGGRK